MTTTISLPSTFDGIGYTRVGGGLPLETISVALPKPGPSQVLIHVFWSSLNPLEYKLAQLNFMGRTPPVILGFDLAGIVVEIGDDVRDFGIGDEVMAMADLNGDGGWATGGAGGFALARDFLTVRKPQSLGFREAAALPMCFLSAYAALQPSLREGDTIYIPGGGGGVGHLAVQMASRALGAARIISSGSTSASRDLAQASGAGWVFNYRVDDVAAEIMALTEGEGVDLVYDTTYSETSFVETAQMVRRGGTWIVLGVGPGKTTRTAETHSPVEGILAARSASFINVNILRYFSEPARLNEAAMSFLRNGMHLAAACAAEGKVVPHVDKTIKGNAVEISDQLAIMAKGTGNLGKIAVDLGSSHGAT
ncbi:NADPH:quinone reductase [Burkholderia sp. D7]|nr:NADPH:quinone reductase [Burkholderia sp. D7]